MINGLKVGDYIEMCYDYIRMLKVYVVLINYIREIYGGIYGLSIFKRR